MNTLLGIHSLLRWVILILGAVALVRYGLAWARGSAFGRLDRSLQGSYSGMMDLQVLLGLIFLVWTGFTGAGFPLVRLEHTFTMIVATAVAHVAARMKADQDALRFRNALLGVGVSLVLIYLGIAVLPGGWSR
jgi:hypothetical protein